MYPPPVISALKEALRNAYWYKNDLRLFFLTCELPDTLISRQGWHDPQEYKVKIAANVIDELISMGDEGIGHIRRLIRGLLSIPNFDYLRSLEDGPAKVSAARKSVEALRQLVEEHDASFRKKTEERKAKVNKGAEAARRRNEEIERLQRRFNELAATEDAQERGRLFEGFLYDLFLTHDLNPRGPFRIVGEQIDGAFEFEGTQFLLEAKWEKSRLGVAPLDSFSKKVERKLDNTLGLFIALNGFTEDGLKAFRGARPNVILMNGQDLATALQGLMDFCELLKRKIRHASQTGEPFLRASDAM